MRAVTREWCGAAGSGDYARRYCFFDRNQFRNLFQCYDLTKSRGKAMATAADYRKWAEECFEWARAASDDGVCEQYASLGRVWLEHAARADLLSGMKIDQAEPKPPRKVA